MYTHPTIHFAYNDIMLFNCYTYIRPILFLLPPEVSHWLTFAVLKLANALGCLKKINVQNNSGISLMGLKFPNRIGLAAGLDKNGANIQPLHNLGFGFIEVGTVTPKPQSGQKKPRLFRLQKNSALINRMGMPNHGLVALIEKLKAKQSGDIVGVNISKNKDTSNDEALNDYIACLEGVYPYASFVTINISSPNTPELRQLQHGHYLSELLGKLKMRQVELQRRSGKKVPLLVKIAPDLNESEINDICHTIQYFKIDGIIVSNTTVNREKLDTEAYAAEQGGLSGQPLFERANDTLRLVRKFLPKPFPIIAVGGVMSAGDAMTKLELGADLVQIYTGLIYNGPKLINACVNATNAFAGTEN